MVLLFLTAGSCYDWTDFMDGKLGLREARAGKVSQDRPRIEPRLFILARYVL